MEFLALVGRCLMSVIFIVSGFGKIFKFTAVAEDMANHRVPLPEAALIATILIEVFCGVALLAGYRTRLAASILTAWLAIVTLVYHTSLVVAQVNDQTIQLLKNLAILGGLLGFVAHGPGSISVDARPHRNRISL